MKKGKLKDRIRIEVRSASEDGYGGEQEEWSLFGMSWAAVYYGTGSEQRAAAQEGAAQAASFEVPANQRTGAITATDHRIIFAGAAWDVTAKIPLGRDGYRLTAVRASA